jgi:hypothetical protein
MAVAGHGYKVIKISVHQQFCHDQEKTEQSKISRKQIWLAHKGKMVVH